MRRFSALALATSLLLATGATVLAQPPQRHARFVATDFRLHVAGQVAPGTTFWVAYGPLNGKFAILRLQPAGNSTFVRRSNLPIGALATYTYVMGQGAVHTRLGQEPGNPVVTIRTVGPLTVRQVPLPTVQWHAPIG
jgi:hypothetical protein